MHQRQLGLRGPMVSALGLGTFSFGGAYGPTDMAESHATLDCAWDHGITFLDTANIYGKGVAETVIGSWLQSRKHRPLIATKAGFTEDPQKRVDNSPAFLRSCLDASLKRLGVDHVALFYAHRHDPDIPAEDLAGTMQRLQDDGKILGYGLSEVAPYTLERAHAVHPVTAVQNEYSLWTRQPELGLIQRCQSLGVAFVPFSPLARGAFGTSLPDPSTFGPDDFRRRVPRYQGKNWQHNRARLQAFHSFARDLGHTPAAMSLAWMLGRWPHAIPIPGTRSAAHLADWITASSITLSDADRAEIDRILPIGWAWGDRYDDAQTALAERYS
jgi:aryl-alcohol dehydrogenase-like predicted oxidoreductase